MKRLSLLPEPLFPFVDFIQTTIRDEIILSPKIIKGNTRQEILELIEKSQMIDKYEQMNEYDLAFVKDDANDSIWIIKKTVNNITICILLYSSEL